MRNYFSILFLCLFISCGSNDTNQKYTHLINKHIELPESILLQRKSTSKKEKTFKFIYYFSSQKSSEVAQLNKYKSFIHDINNDVDILFISDQETNLYSNISRTPLSSQILVDSTKQFKELNKEVLEVGNTILIKNNCLVAIGDPTSNPEIHKEYLKNLSLSELKN